MGMRGAISLIDLVLLPMIVGLYGVTVGFIVKGYQSSLIKIQAMYEKNLKDVILRAVSEVDQTTIPSSSLEYFDIEETESYSDRFNRTLCNIYSICRSNNYKFRFCKTLDLFMTEVQACGS